jgi:hypothetical protein
MPVLNRMSSIMPSQNSGIAYSVRVTAVEPLSNPLSRFQPARIPIAMPMIVDSTVDVPSRMTVGHT